MAYTYCGAGGQHKSCPVYPELVARDIAALGKKVFLGNGPVLLPEPHRSHLLFFYRDAYSKMFLFLPFLRDGIDKNEKCIYLTEDDYPSQIRIYLNWGDIAPEKVKIFSEREWYRPHGTFDPEASQKKYEEEALQALQEGYTGLRVIGDQGMLLQKAAPEERRGLLDFEERLHHHLGNIAMKAICAYDLNELPPEAFLRLLGAHHIIAAPLTQRQLSHLSQYIPTLEMDEISYHIGKLGEGRLKLIRKEGYGYCFCETASKRLLAKAGLAAMLSVEKSLESAMDEIIPLLIQDAANDS
ncbi:MAG: MEDS domain-containing protein [Candidatus Omnitrophota bacterium]